VRRTPLIALLLAPFALFAVVMAWNELLLPLTAKMWRSEFSLRARVATGSPALRIRALRDAASVHKPDATLVALLVEHAQHDPERAVRSEAWRSLGFIGARQPLPAAALAAIATAVLGEQDDAVLSAAFEAAGRAAAKNRIGEDVVLRIARATDENHLAWLYPRAIEALALIGAAQPLPEAVYARLRAAFETPRRDGEREDLARAFEAIAKGGGRLPLPVLEALTKAVLEVERNTRIRVHAVYALAHSAAQYPQAKSVLSEATRDGVQDVRRAAEHGLRIVEAERVFAQRAPMAVALDRSLPVETRLKAMPALRVNRRDAAWRADVIALTRDPDPRIVVAALELLRFVGGAPDDAFDRDALIPQLRAGMADPDPQVRRAAYAALGRQLGPNGPYRSHAAEFRTALEAGTLDPEPPVRVVALASLMRIASSTAEHDAVLERALADADPYVRRNVVGWLGSPRTETGKREALLALALADPDPGVRSEAEAAREKWQTRPRSWPVEWWTLWQAGEYKKLGLTALTAVTVAAPIIVGLVFFVYFMARLLTYLYQRRWRALAVVAVMAVWAAAGWGVFLVYFAAGHASRLDGWQTLQLAGLLWLVVALYAGLGWALHYAVRRR
jgi:HEAT repeat protein